MQAQCNQVKIFSPLAIRERLQKHYLKQPHPNAIENKVRNAVIHKGLGKSVKAALGQYDGQKYDYSKPANEESDHVRRLVLGWILLSDSAVFKPVSSNDHTIVTPQAVTGLSRWISEEIQGEYRRRPAFGVELEMVIGFAQTNFTMLEVNPDLTMADCVVYWQRNSAIWSGDTDQSMHIHFDMGNFGDLFVAKHIVDNGEIKRGEELLAETAKAYGENYQTSKVPEKPVFDELESFFS